LSEDKRPIKLAQNVLFVISEVKIHSCGTLITLRTLTCREVFAALRTRTPNLYNRENLRGGVFYDKVYKPRGKRESYDGSGIVSIRPSKNPYPAMPNSRNAAAAPKAQKKECIAWAI
jgi:hypothetical protein